MTPLTPNTNPVSQEPSSEGKTWDKKKSETDKSTVNELLRMSHTGYGAPVSSWNGTRAQLDKEVNNERREERKRALSDNSDQGRVKHQKINSHGAYKSNPGYNPIQVILVLFGRLCLQRVCFQEFHNAKNWGQNNGSHYRAFFNGNMRRRNYLHKNNYHKNNHHRFRH